VSGLELSGKIGKQQVLSDKHTNDSMSAALYIAKKMIQLEA
jgi:hypothetical protein